MLYGIFESLFQLLDAGGFVVWIHLGMSVLLLTILLLKLFQFLATGVLSPFTHRRADRVVQHWENGEHASALETAMKGRDPQSRLLLHAAQYLQHNALQGQALLDELAREAAGYLARLRSHLHIIELIAGLAPLLGLLGTVLGMIEAFQAMEAAGKQVDPSTLSGGIWVALLTTAVGLVVAMPAVIIHNWLEKRVDNYAAGLNDRVGRMLTASARTDHHAHVASTTEHVANLELKRAHQ